uniref:Secreted protein n=1 Tax=Mesocestoides corti TaxID=53468 RepID=A0A5K3F697_MESCO
MRSKRSYNNSSMVGVLVILATYIACFTEGRLTRFTGLQNFVRLKLVKPNRNH